MPKIPNMKSINYFYLKKRFVYNLRIAETHGIEFVCSKCGCIFYKRTIAKTDG